MPWTTPNAPSLIDVNSCVQCGLCLPSCPTFRLTGRETASPRGRLTAMIAIADGLEVDRPFAEIMETCVQCRACEVVCPAFVPFGTVMEAARAEISAQRQGLGRQIRRMAVGRLVRNRRVLRAGTMLLRLAKASRTSPLLPRRLRGLVTGTRRVPRASSIVGLERSAIGQSRGKVAVLAGCVMDQWFPGVHSATIEVLVRAGYDVVVPPSQTCCGALAAHDGWVEEARSMAEVNVDAFADVDLVVANAAGCGSHLKEYDRWSEYGSALSAKVRDVTELVAESIAAGTLPTIEVGRGRVGIQDPCHLRYGQRIIDEPRQVLMAAGLEVVEIDPAGMCCGAGGLYSMTQPEMSDQLGRAKGVEIERSGVKLVASANPGCEMQLRAHVDPSINIAHPVELYWEALAGL